MARKTVRKNQYCNIATEYMFSDKSVMQDDDRIARLKLRLQEIPVADRTVLILYAELGSLRKLGEVLGVSHTAARIAVAKARQLILIK